jgi:large subunit ribosomal protein L33
MAEGKFTKQLTKLRCEECSSLNYRTRKNSKSVDRKIELKKFCKKCRKHTLHKESKK